MATPTARMFQKLRQQRLPPLPSVRDLVKLYQLNAIKHLSQNFLLDEKLTSKIVKAAGNVSDCAVCEVGPGPGSITRSILQNRPRKVILIEKDRRFEKTLKILEDACPGIIDCHWGDVLSFEMSKMFPEDLRRDWNDEIPQIHIIGNLPFNISTPLISRWLSKMSDRGSAWSYGRVPLTLTFQKEVAERLVADVGNEQRSRLSIMAQYLTEPLHKFTIKGSAFVPKPDVDVGVVKFKPRKHPLINHPYKLVEKVVRHAFCMRGKYFCKPISTLFPDMVRVEFTKMLFDMCLVFPNIRPYGLTIDDFGRICDAYAIIIQKYPEIGEYEYRQTRADKTFEELYSAKYEVFKDATVTKPARMKPLEIIPSDLAAAVSEEIMAEKMMDEEDIFFVK